MVSLPAGGYFGVTAKTGGLFDRHDLLRFSTYGIGDMKEVEQPIRARKDTYNANNANNANQNANQNQGEKNINPNPLLSPEEDNVDNRYNKKIYNRDMNRGDIPNEPPQVNQNRGTPGYQNQQATPGYQNQQATPGYQNQQANAYQNDAGVKRGEFVYNLINLIIG